ncbi:MAG: molybdopterin converting factor subunit 1 [Myxococcota bacterium]|jgi:molybdopterin converting factor subunit 1
MQVRILYFAGCREAAGRSDDTVALPDGSTVAEALAWVMAERPAVTGYLKVARIAVNRDFCEPDQPLKNGDEIVLIPPVSGGGGVRAALSHDPIEPDAATTLIDTSRAGSIITFSGVVRPTSKQGRAVTTLFYEAYEPMAVEKLEQCLTEAGERWPLLDAAIVHRLGQLKLGEVAVSIGVSTKHRKEGFAATEYIIDRLKEIVPIWKKETGPDGSEWVSEGA